MAKGFDPHEPNKPAPVNPCTRRKDLREKAVVRQRERTAGHELHRQLAARGRSATKRSRMPSPQRTAFSGPRPRKASMNAAAFSSS